LNLGYVPDEDMAALYQSAIALVMPTLFGPTNIPVLEAWKLNCLVVTSDLRGIREQVGDAGILVNPYDAYAWASVVAKIWENSDQYLAIKQAGQKRLEQYTEDDFRTKVRVILEEIIAEERGIYAEDSASA
jgi:glycosyltransferase involved in cell wall biosynthesis